MQARPSAILDHLASLADTTRSRLLLLLDRHELTVSELCAITQLPQSTVSRHLKALVDGGWISARIDGTSRLYTMTRPSADAPRASRNGRQDNDDAARRRLWLLVRDHVGPTPGAAQDQRRLQAALAERRVTSQEFFSSSAGQWDRLRDDLFGDRFHVAALAALADPTWTIGDLGCGTGQLSAVLAPFVAEIIAVDASAAMLQAARKRLHGMEHVSLRRGDLESLPIDNQRLDAATLMLVLHHLPEPALAVAEVARVLKPHGRVIIADMLPHDRDGYRRQMGHVWLGFAPDHLEALLTDHGFSDVRIIPLHPDPKAKGPGLFIATARRSTDTRSHDAHTGD